MEPIPETVEAADELDPNDDGLLTDLVLAAEDVRELVPDLVGISLAHLREGLTFTVVATDADVAVLDAVQYLAGGPCVDAVRAERVLEEQFDDPASEQRWQLFAQATAARTVRSTLTLPILTDGVVTGSVNLYGGSGSAFRGLHQEIAAVFGAWAPGAVANADLSFSTRRDAEDAPRRLAEQRAIDTASGIIAERTGLDADSAVRKLRDAAERAGVPDVELARAVVESVRHRDGEGPRADAE